MSLTFVSTQPLYVFGLEHLVSFTFKVIIHMYVHIAILLIVLDLFLQIFILFFFSCSFLL